MKLTVLTAALGLALLPAPLLADTPPKDYPLKTCPVSDDKLDDDAVKVTAKDGTVVYLCCDSCIKDFKKDPEKYAQAVKDAKAKKK
jgi:YHS domain-containing protein